MMPLLPFPNRNIGRDLLLGLVRLRWRLPQKAPWLLKTGSLPPCKWRFTPPHPTSGTASTVKTAASPCFAGMRGHRRAHQIPIAR